MHTHSREATVPSTYILEVNFKLNLLVSLLPLRKPPSSSLMHAAPQYVVAPPLCACVVILVKRFFVISVFAPLGPFPCTVGIDEESLVCCCRGRSQQ